MSPRAVDSLTAEDRKAVLEKLSQGAAFRARTLALVFAAGFLAFGLTSHPNILRFKPGLTLWDNTWPRILFNTLPFLFIAWGLRRWKTAGPRSLWYWTIGFPLVFIAACNIHVWPTLLQGHSTLYLYVHGANIIVLLMGFILVAQPPKHLAITLGILFAGFCLPITWIFLKVNDTETLSFLWNDFGFTFILGCIASYKNYQLRFALAREDLSNKRRIQKFVGHRVTESVFENNADLLKPQTGNAFVLVLDFRGFTNVARTAGEVEKKSFMQAYHKAVSQVMHKHHGFIHKTAGDGFIASFGLLDEQADLSDIPDLEIEEALAAKRRNQDLARNAVDAFLDIVAELKRLQTHYDCAKTLVIGAALDFGQLECKLMGDENTRLEFDIDGISLIRCTRLESYTKYLIEHYRLKDSLIAVSDTAAVHLENIVRFSHHSTGENPVRDFPEMKAIYYLEASRKRAA